MPLSKDDLIARHPRLYHISLARSIDDLHRHGLLSTQAILDKFEVMGDRRYLLERRRRARLQVLSHDRHGEIALNDQYPLYEGGLRKCLVDMSVEEWCENLNGRVFFWPDKPQPKGFNTSKLGRTYARMMVSVDTRDFLNHYGAVVEFSPINSGNATRRAAVRGRETFAGFDAYQHKSIHEITVPYAVMHTHLFQVETLT